MVARGMHGMVCNNGRKEREGAMPRPRVEVRLGVSGDHRPPLTNSLRTLRAIDLMVSAVVVIS